MTPEERIAALEARVAVLEARLAAHSEALRLSAVAAGVLGHTPAPERPRRGLHAV